ncbi:Nucleic acid-binding OB-fold [Penicillium bovifimosum]|uniref:Nucleic acid-binding OB-fold n=1 Tax=Penicillium bovifimosum TaxID=126998 RepID=A0A9W9HHU4_9EURO|nr:Nucleic acid-binding OB-fold [Penicillium bovifimosum]KAJ5146115.1 Nucleic acid-binding OB-fold [Penicillium bovifimosum]
MAHDGKNNNKDTSSPAEGNHRVCLRKIQLSRCDGAKHDRRQGDPDVRFDPEVAMVIVSVR